MKLEHYHQKRDFKKTSEPKGHVHHRKTHRFCIQKHDASHLHYDFRIELDGVLKSWAVPKGPSLDPKVKRLAIQVEDHPIEYGNFEGIIPKNEYGGGTVMLWDKGTWKPLDEDPDKAYQKGHLRFELKAKKLGGRWDLIRLKEQDKSWFLIKYKDDYAKSDKYDITVEQPDSALSDKSIDEIAEHYSAIWSKKGKKKIAQNKTKSAIKINLNLTPGPMPEKISPQLATLVDKAPPGQSWMHEIKYDGYRIIALKKGNQITLLTRNNHDWTDRFPSITEALKQLPIEKGIFDGEIVLLDNQSRSSFQLLQNAIKANQEAPFIYYIFDLLYYEQWDIRTLPLEKRKTILKPLLSKKTPELRYSDHISGHGNELLKQTCDFELEGIISKNANSHYLGKRTKTWLKIKCHKRQEFVIGGFSPPKNTRSYFGSLYLGVYDKKGNFIYCGNVGTGFTQNSLKEVYTALKKLSTKENPFNSNPPGIKSAIWVQPLLVVEVEFSEWTDDGRLRHPSFKGLRHDKSAKEVIKETEHGMDKSEAKKTSNNTSKIMKATKLSHPDKILYKEDGITKKELLHYYSEIAPHILPFITKRPLTLVRCPSEYKDCFYQKKLNDLEGGLLAIPVKNKKNNTSEDYIYIDDEEGLFELVQLDVLEIHPWGSRIDRLEYPDMITFDLDPAEEVAWKKVVDAAFEVKQHLESFNLTSFVKTTGGKGLHVVIPIKDEYNWDDVKNFSQVFAQFMEKNSPDKYVSGMSKAKRKGKIFIDYLRNQRGATAIAAYSTRARIHAPVSTPLDWDELTNNIKDTSYTIKTVTKRLSQLQQDPWNKIWNTKQSLRLDELE